MIIQSCLKKQFNSLLIRLDQYQNNAHWLEYHRILKTKHPAQLDYHAQAFFADDEVTMTRFMQFNTKCSANKNPDELNNITSDAKALLKITDEAAIPNIVIFDAQDKRLTEESSKRINDGKNRQFISITLMFIMVRMIERN